MLIWPLPPPRSHHRGYCYKLLVPTHPWHDTLSSEVCVHKYIDYKGLYVVMKWSFLQFWYRILSGYCYLKDWPFIKLKCCFVFIFTQNFEPLTGLFSWEYFFSYNTQLINIYISDFDRKMYDEKIYNYNYFLPGWQSFLGTGKL